jgi:hypothetical protein
MKCILLRHLSKDQELGKLCENVALTGTKTNSNSETFSCGCGTHILRSAVIIRRLFYQKIVELYFNAFFLFL